MKLRVKVDQRAALLRGINAPTSIIDIELDPSSLTETERAELVRHMADDGISLVWVSDQGNQYKDKLLQVDDPSLEGIKAAVARASQAIAKAEAEEAQRQRERTEAALDILAKRQTCSSTDYLYAKIGSGSVAYDRIRPNFGYNAPESVTGSPEAQAWMAEIEKANAVAYAEAEAKRAELERVGAARKAQEALEHKARVAAAREIITQSGSSEQQERLRRGFMTEEQLEKAATDLLTSRFYLDCPLAPLGQPDPAKIDLNDYDPAGEVDEDELPELMDCDEACPTKNISDKLMRRIIPAEKALKPWIGEREVTTTVWRRGVSRDHNVIPWTWIYGLRLSTVERGFTLENFVAI